MKYLWVLDENNQFKKVIDTTERVFYTCLQELALWKKENPMNIEDGVDYKGIRNRQVFFKQEVLNVVNNYTDTFDSIEVSDAYPSENGEGVSIDIQFIKGLNQYNYTIEQQL